MSELFIFEFVEIEMISLFSCDFLSFIHLIEILDLWGNYLTGTIPTQLGRLTDLEVLWLYENRLTGTIPSQIGKMKKLKKLNLRENNLNGSIPSQLFDATELIDLYLNLNGLTGSISTFIGQLDKLERRKW